MIISRWLKANIFFKTFSSPKGKVLGLGGFRGIFLKIKRGGAEDGAYLVGARRGTGQHFPPCPSLLEHSHVAYHYGSVLGPEHEAGNIFFRKSISIDRKSIYRSIDIDFRPQSIDF